MTTWQELYTGLEDMSVKGGSDIGVVAAQAFCAYVREHIGVDSFLYESAQGFAEKIKRLKPSMGTVQTVIDQLLGLLDHDHTDDAQVLQAIESFVQRYHQETEESLTRMAAIAANVIQDGDVVFTHSYTRSVLLAIEKAYSAGKHFSVISTESRPRNEGAYLASLLAGMGIDVTLITDASAAHYMPRISRVFVGADGLYTDGTVVNKMGTLGIAILAAYYRVPVYVLSITAKLYRPSLQGFQLEMERRPAEEVWNEPNSIPSMRVENIFFEEVPPELVTYLVTERGVIKPGQLYTLCTP